MSGEHRQYLRFLRSDRTLHLLLLISFSILALTGLPQKYADAGISIGFIRLLGGIEQVRVIHHTFAVILILTSIAHVVQLGYRVFVQRVSLDMLPRWKDITDFFDAMRYNLGLTDEMPRYERYNFIEKLEYWAVVWGTVLMTVTGYVLWNPILATSILPGEFVPAAKIAHGMEAILAVLAIITWHFYFVHLAKFNKSIFTGYLDEEEMREEHAVELERRLVGDVRSAPGAELRWRRLRIYAPLATLFVVVSLVGTWWFLTAEQTAITTVPRIAPEEKVYQPVDLEELPMAGDLAPLPTPVRVLMKPTPAPPAVTHEVDAARAQCSLCHDPFGVIAPAPPDHEGRADDQCLSCHQAQGGEQ